LIIVAVGRDLTGDRGEGQSVRHTALRVGVLTLLLALAAAPSRAQTPPAPSAAPPPTQPFTGFVSPYEIVHTLRSAGFDPLAPPLREGTTYVVRATDFRGILMRVVVDARTGAIRDANRIVPGPGRYGALDGVASSYGPDLDAGAMAPGDSEVDPPLLRPAVARPPAHPPLLAPPLPRPRPATLASRKPEGDPKASDKSSTKSSAKAQPAPATDGAAKSGTNSAAGTADAAANPNVTPAPPAPAINSEVITAAPPAAAAAPKKLPDPPLND
jgi:hypothetical protein